MSGFSIWNSNFQTDYKLTLSVMINLDELSTRAPQDLDRETAEKRTKQYAKRIAELQEAMIADGSKSLLVVLQGMDASGKDGAVKNVFKYCSHLNISVAAFKKPSKLELAHDFLWRVHQRVPAKGEIKIFNRSHYEDVLIQRVHGWIDEERAQRRMRSINAFEELLQYDNATTVLKFYLHLSYDQQREELMERIDESEKNYKYNAGDWEQRQHWDRYRECYNEVLNTCNTIPWIVCPVDQRWYRNYTMSKAVVEAMEAMDLNYPGLPDDFVKPGKDD